MHRKGYLVCMLLTLLLASCEGQKIDGNTGTASESETVTDYKEAPLVDVVALVNEIPITQEQLDFAITRLIPKDIDDKDKVELTGKVLDSLISSRIMAIKAQESLGESDRVLLREKVNAYKEELLVKMYITENIEPTPITRDIVYQYYLDNIGDFGSGVEKTFEIIRSTSNINELDRSSLLKQMSLLSSEDNWLLWFEKNKGPQLDYRKSTSLVSLLKSPLKELVESTGEGEISPLSNAKELIIVKVHRIKKVPAKKFEQVSGEIRRLLAPEGLKTAIKQHLDDLKENAVIEKYSYD